MNFSSKLRDLSSMEVASNGHPADSSGGWIASHCDEEFESDIEEFESDVDADDEEEEEPYGSTSVPKLQFRNDVSQARWDEDMAMAEVLKNKGRMATTTGVIREGKLFCSIEETLFLAERGALSISGSENNKVSLEDLYKRPSGEAPGYSWELFEAYRHLKSLGYIVGRHGVPWTTKRQKSFNTSLDSGAVDEISSPLIDKLELDFSNITLDANAQAGDLIPHFDVYLPNSKFRKSSPGDPSFKLFLCRGNPPPRRDVELLEEKCKGIPLKICLVDHGRVNYFSFNKVDLPQLP